MIFILKISNLFHLHENDHVLCWTQLRVSLISPNQCCVANIEPNRSVWTVSVYFLFFTPVSLLPITIFIQLWGCFLFALSRFVLSFAPPRCTEKKNTLKRIEPHVFRFSILAIPIIAVDELGKKNNASRPSAKNWNEIALSCDKTKSAAA